MMTMSPFTIFKLDHWDCIVFGHQLARHTPMTKFKYDIAIKIAYKNLTVTFIGIH